MQENVGGCGAEEGVNGGDGSLEVLGEPAVTPDPSLGPEGSAMAAVSPEPGATPLIQLAGSR